MWLFPNGAYQVIIAQTFQCHSQTSLEEEETGVNQFYLLCALHKLQVGHSKNIYAVNTWRFRGKWHVCSGHENCLFPLPLPLLLSHLSKSES